MTSQARKNADKLRGILTTQGAGIFGNSGDDVTDALNALIVQARDEQMEVVLGPGAFLVRNLEGQDNVILRGQGLGRTIIRRMPAAVGNASPLTFSGKSGFALRDLTVDGNKAAQTNGSAGCTLSGCWDYEVRNCSFINSKANAGYGEGLLIIDDANRANDTESSVIRNRFKNNDGTGCLISRAWNIKVRQNFGLNNTGDGIAIADYSFPIVDNANSRIQVSGNQCHGNQGNGILVRGYVVGGSISLPVYGPSANSSYVNVVDNICNGNRVYGIAYQGAIGNVKGNTCAGNTGTGFSAGILFNCLYSNCTGNTVSNNEVYGIDAGGSYISRIADNNCYTDGEVGINLGASFKGACDNNTIVQTGADIDIGITYASIDGDGLTPFAQIGQGTSITRNKIMLNANAGSVGISVQGDVLGCIVHDNEVYGATNQFQAYQLGCDLIDVQGNTDDYTNNVVGSRWNSVASAATLVVPDWVERTYVSGTTNITAVKSYSESLFAGKVRAIRMSNQGSGYSQSTPPTVALVGGGGAGATADALVDNGGRLIGFTITNGGSGYTSAPAVNITHNGGVGAVGAAIINCNNTDARELTLLFNGVLTVVDGAGLDLTGDFVTVANKSKLKLIGTFGGQTEMARNTS